MQLILLKGVCLFSISLSSNSPSSSMHWNFSLSRPTLANTASLSVPTKISLDLESAGHSMSEIMAITGQKSESTVRRYLAVKRDKSLQQCSDAVSRALNMGQSAATHGQVTMPADISIQSSIVQEAKSLEAAHIVLHLPGGGVRYSTSGPATCPEPSTSSRCFTACLDRALPADCLRLASRSSAMYSKFGVKEPESAEAKFKQVLEGWLRELPDQEKTIVRVFLSSTFTDTGEERNALFRDAIPKLRVYCRERRLDFQVADMRWGVRDDAALEHKTTDLCIREVLKCRQVSLGPCFAVILGAKYGHRYYPNEIPTEEFNQLIDEAKRLKLDDQSIHRWFKLDANSRPPRYVLLPITAVLVNYDNRDDERLRREDEKKWQLENASITEFLRSCAKSCVSKATMTEADAFKYLASVTEQEIQAGLLDAEARFENFDEINIGDRIASRFIDIEDGEVASEPQALLHRLKSTKISAVLSESQMLKYLGLKWTDKGVDSGLLSHTHYLKNLCRDFVNLVCQQVDSARSSQFSYSMESPELYTEVLHHLHLAVSKLETFAGRSADLERVRLALMSERRSQGDATAAKTQKDEDKEESPSQQHQKMGEALQEQMGVSFAMDDTEERERERQRKLTESPLSQPGDLISRPVILHGPSGSGKTSLAAAVASTADAWFPTVPVKVLRFLGTSAQSLTIKRLLASMCHQICLLYSLHELDVHTDPELSTDYHFLVKHFKALLYRASAAATDGRALLLVLDSVDQLETSDGAHSLSFLPSELPANVKLVVTFASDRCLGVCLSSARGRFPNDCLVQLDPMVPADSQALVESLLKAAGRSLTGKQRQVLLQSVSKTGQPLFSKLLVDQALKWRSFTEVGNDSLPTTLDQAIDQVLTGLEKSHGQMLVSRAFAYLALSRSGLTEQELEDVLSLDDEVLQDTYLHQLPPDPKMVRLPPLLWTRIRDDCGEYLVTRQGFGGSRVVAWYHRQFAEAAERRYCSDSQLNEKLHSCLADYFSGRWYGQTKPLELFKRKKASYADCDRGAPAQPLRLTSFQLNLRQLDELPHHLMLGGRVAEFVDRYACNVDWLIGVAEALGLSRLLSDLELAIEKASINEADNKSKRACEDLLATLELLHSCLISSPRSLTAQLVGQWAGCSSVPVHFKTLCKRAVELAEGQQAPCLLPLSQCVPQPGGELVARREVVCGYPGGRFNDSPFARSLDYQSLFVTQFKHGGTSQLQMLDTRLRMTDSFDLPFDIHQGMDAVFDTVSKSLVFGSPQQCWRLCFTHSGRSLLCLDLTNPKASRLQLFDFPLESLSSSDAPKVRVVYSLDSEDVLLHAFTSVCGRYVVGISSLLEYLVWPVESEKLSYRIRSFIGEEYSDKDKFTASLVRDQLEFLATWNQLLVPVGPHTFVTSEFPSLSTSHLDKTGECDLALIDVSKGEAQRLPNGYVKYKLSLLCPSPDARFLLAAYNQHIIINGNSQWPILVYDMARHRVVSRIPASRHAVTGMAWLSIEQGLVCHCLNHDRHLTVSTFRPATLQASKYLDEAETLCSIGGHESELLLCWSWRGYLLTVAKDNICCVWDRQKLIDRAVSHRRSTNPEVMRELQELEAQTGYEKNPESEKTVGLHLSVQYNLLACIRSSGWVLFHDLGSGNLKPKQSRKYESPICLTESNESWLVVAEKHGVLHCILLKKCAELHTLSIEGGEPSCLALSNNILVAGKAGMECYGYVFDLSTGERMHKMPGLYGFNQVGLTPNGKKCIGTFFDFPIAYSLETGDSGPLNPNQMDTMMAGCSAIAVSDDSRLAAAASTDGSVKLIEADSGKYLKKFQLRSSCICMKFFPSNGRTLVTAGFRSLLFWSVEGGSLERCVRRHKSFVLKLQFTPDYQRMVTVGMDHCLIVWETARWTVLSTFESLHGINCLAFTPDLNYLAIDCGPVAAYAGLKLTKRPTAATTTTSVAQSAAAATAATTSVESGSENDGVAFNEITGTFSVNPKSATCLVM
uniref:WD_REPEATS_REGION domain-containing protein n=1 Tax=Macrostomum lignano TaxID=282301 RepID=A0A1I8JF78_9PLAT